MQRLSKFNQLTSLVFVLFLTFHFNVLMPVMHYACFCPEVDPEWKCTCMCAKCAARKANTGSARNLLSNVHPAKKPHTTFVSIGGYAIVMNSRFLEIPNISVETMACKCGGEVKNIAAEIKAFIPMLFFGILISTIAFKLISRYFRLHPEIFLPPQKRPG